MELGVLGSKCQTGETWVVGWGWGLGMGEALVSPFNERNPWTFMFGFMHPQGVLPWVGVKA